MLQSSGSLRQTVTSLSGRWKWNSIIISCELKTEVRFQAGIMMSVFITVFTRCEAQKISSYHDAAGFLPGGNLSGM
jgi:hypothetical protein